MELANQIHELILYLIGQFHHLSALLSFNYVQRAVYLFISLSSAPSPLLIPSLSLSLSPL